MQTKKLKNSIKPGNIFQLGDNHRLLCADARNKKLVKKLIGKDEIRMILVDVPYAVGYVQSKDGFKQNIAKPKDIIGDQIQSESEYSAFTKQWLEIAIPHLQRKNSVYIFNSDKMIFALREGMKDAGLNFSQLLIWIKNNAVIGRKDYLIQHELIAFGWYGTHLFAKAKDKSVLFCPKPNKSELHPTMKPVSLLRRLILNSSKVGDTIYDCFTGSGSILIASEQTKRKCLMVEIDPEYCQTIIDRFKRLTGQKVKKIYE